MNVWFYAECALVLFLSVVLIGGSITSIQLTIKKGKQNNYEKEVQEELNNIVKEEMANLTKEHIRSILKSGVHK